MLARSRNARCFDAFDRKLDAAITPLLHLAGFAEVQPYLFRRQADEGYDLIYFDVAGTAAASFCVYMLFKPRYMDEIDDLYSPLLLRGQPNLGGCSYLTPRVMTHRPREYHCKTSAGRDQALEAASEGLRTHALAWLDSLRDRSSYADAVSPETLMYFGRANEVAGRLGAARAAYETQLTRELACFDAMPLDKFLAFEGCRAFVYLCLKLNRELGKCERVITAMGDRPQVLPLADQA